MDHDEVTLKSKEFSLSITRDQDEKEEREGEVQANRQGPFFYFSITSIMETVTCIDLARLPSCGSKKYPKLLDRVLGTVRACTIGTLSELDSS